MSDLLALLELLIGIPDYDSSKDILLEHYLAQARLAACGYCNVDSLPETFDGTITDLAAYFYKNRDTLGITTQKQGERSVSYSKNIPDYIMAALPLPKVQVIGHVL